MFLKGTIVGWLALAAVIAAGPAAAQSYPNKSIRIIVPFAAGGASDVMARVVGDKLFAKWNQPIVVENRTGAGGTLGADVVAKSAPDGYTLLLGTSATHTIAPSLYANLSYDPEKDFAPISAVSTIPLVLTVTPELPAKSVAELIAYAKKNPGEIEFASSGNGSITHLSGEMFAHMAGIKLVHVPYRGSAPAITDLLGGRIKMMIDHTPTVLTHIRAGKLTALGVADPKRLEDLPDVPTIAEAGVPGYEVRSWVGILAPKGTPADVVDALNKAIVEALAMPDAIERLKSVGARSAANSPEQFAQLIATDRKLWAEVVTRAGVTPSQ